MKGALIIGAGMGVLVGVAVLIMDRIQPINTTIKDALVVGVLMFVIAVPLSWCYDRIIHEWEKPQR